MNVIPSFLSLEIHTSDGLMTEFYQAEPKLIRETLRLLWTPRLFTQPQLFLASGRHASAFTGRSIDVILARTDATIQGFLPMSSPAGPINVFESNVSFPTSDLGIAAHGPHSDSQNPRVVHVQVHTLGGWNKVLEVHAEIRGAALDRRQTFANFFTPPVISFHLKTGGIGLINPANLTCTKAYPSNDDQPETSLPMNLAGRSSRPTYPMRVYSIQP
ncbi:MAG: hypothetical protein SFY81_01385 [Verrucomicrobiota bacterium]|nr:hypothetical protein [Verrucomicrobiota bacterium]